MSITSVVIPEDRFEIIPVSEENAASGNSWWSPTSIKSNLKKMVAAGLVRSHLAGLARDAVVFQVARLI